jgi:hypothetical protein
MSTSDVVSVPVLLWWWIFRKRYDWKAVFFFYVGGVMFADIFCAGLILVFIHRSPGVLHAPALLMPLGGLVSLAYGGATNRLRKGSRPFGSKKEDAPQPEVSSDRPAPLS